MTRERARSATKAIRRSDNRITDKRFGCKEGQVTIRSEQPSFWTDIIFVALLASIDAGGCVVVTKWNFIEIHRHHIQCLQIYAHKVVKAFELSKCSPGEFFLGLELTIK